VDEATIKLERCSHSLSEPVVPHTHDFFEFAYIVQGNAVHIMNDKRIPVKAGDYFAINIGIPHMYIGDIDVINCMFYPELIDKV